MKKLLFLLIATVICFSNTWTQNFDKFIVQNLTLENGLPSNEVYHVVEDKEGYIWFATNNGISKYNGNEHLIFTSKEGLPTDIVYHFYPQTDSSIIGICSSGEFFKIKGGNISLILHPDTSRKYIKPGHFPYGFYEDSKGNYHIGSRFGYFCFDPKSKLLKVDTIRTNNFFGINCVTIEDDFCFCYDVLTQKYSSDSITFEFNSKPLKNFSLEAKVRHSNYAIQWQNHVVTPFRSGLYFYNFDKQSVTRHLILEEFISVSGFKNHLYAGVKNGGVVHFVKERDNIIQRDRYFDNLSISSVVLSSDNILWLSTLEDGVRKIDFSSSQLIFEAQPENNITSFCEVDSFLVIGCENGKVLRQDGRLLHEAPVKIYEITSYENQLFIAHTNLTVLDDKFTEQDPPYAYPTGDKIQSVKFVKYNDSIYVNHGYTYLTTVNTNSGKIKCKKYKELINASSDIEVIEDSCYAVLSNQLLVFHPMNLNATRKVMNKSKIIHVFEHNNQVFTFSIDLKLNEVKKNGGYFGSLPKINGVNRAIDALYHQGILHVSTNKGVYSWQLPKNEKEQFQLVNFEKIPLVKMIKIFDDQIYFSTSKKIFSKKLSTFQPRIPKLFIRGIELDDEILEQPESITLNYDENNLIISLETIYFEGPVMNFRYKLEGHESDYFYTSERSINYSELQPGEYVFKVAATVDGYNYSEEKIIKIYIAPPYWMTWWFWSIMGILFSTIIFLLVRVRIKQIKKRMALRATISKLQSQALTAQLNPHLVFNILNSIQGMVSEEETEKANIYIARFSKFIRNSLNHSKHNVYSVGEEIEMTQKYFELEKLRFQNEISFTIQNDLSDLSIQVPPLIVQPLVENAIKHGVRPNTDEKGAVKVYFEENNDFLLIRVEDNGIGIIENQIYGDGLRITSERVNVLSRENKLEILKIKNPTTIQISIKK